MSVYFSICVSLSVGLILGAVGGGVKKKLIKKDYTQKQIARNIKFISKAAGLLKYVTCLVLLLGLLWCSYCGGRDAYRKVRFMIKQIKMLLVALSVIFFMTACKDSAGYTAVQSMWNKDMLLSLKQALLEKAIASYYGGDGTAAAMAFMKHKSVQRFMAMWVHEETKDIDQPIWNYDSFARVSIRNHELKELYTDKQFYSCTFTDGHGRWGYCIFQYDEKEFAVSNWEVKETTPYQYDLRVNMKEIVDRIMKTDLDILTTSASSVYLYDEEKKQAEQVILFHDENAAYICYYEDAVLRMEKV